MDGEAKGVHRHTSKVNAIQNKPVFQASIALAAIASQYCKPIHWQARLVLHWSVQWSMQYMLSELSQQHQV
jgi:hypothetical protein